VALTSVFLVFLDFQGFSFDSENYANNAIGQLAYKSDGYVMIIGARRKNVGEGSKRLN
jgi:hypothetical protein